MLALYLVVPLPLMNHSINEEKEPLSLLKVLIYLDLVNSVLEAYLFFSLGYRRVPYQALNISSNVGIWYPC